MSKPSMDGYVDVAERIQQFYEKFPEGSLRREGNVEYRALGEKLFVVYKALAYRHPEDRLPGQGTAWEPFPGPTSFTKDSELQNAETAAWGRAIVAVGIVANKIASKQEVQARTGSEQAGVPILEPPPSPAEPRTISEAQAKDVKARIRNKKMTAGEVKAVLTGYTEQTTVEGIPLTKLSAVLEEINRP